MEQLRHFVSQEARVSQAKMESKRLLRIALENAGVIHINKLNEAQALVAKLNGSDSWRELVRQPSVPVGNQELVYDESALVGAPSSLEDIGPLAPFNPAKSLEDRAWTAVSRSQNVLLYGNAYLRARTVQAVIHNSTVLDMAGDHIATRFLVLNANPKRPTESFGSHSAVISLANVGPHMQFPEADVQDALQLLTASTWRGKTGDTVAANRLMADLHSSHQRSFSELLENNQVTTADLNDMPSEFQSVMASFVAAGFIRAHKLSGRKEDLVIVYDGVPEAFAYVAGEDLTKIFDDNSQGLSRLILVDNSDKESSGKCKLLIKLQSVVDKVLGEPVEPPSLPQEALPAEERKGERSSLLAKLGRAVFGEPAGPAKLRDPQDFLPHRLVRGDRSAKVEYMVNAIDQARKSGKGIICLTDESTVKNHLILTGESLTLIASRRYVPEDWHRWNPFAGQTAEMIAETISERGKLLPEDEFWNPPILELALAVTRSLEWLTTTGSITPDMVREHLPLDRVEFLLETLRARRESEDVPIKLIKALEHYLFGLPGYKSEGNEAAAIRQHHYLVNDLIRNLDIMGSLVTNAEPLCLLNTLRKGGKILFVPGLQTEEEPPEFWPRSLPLLQAMLIRGAIASVMNDQSRRQGAGGENNPRTLVLLDRVGGYLPKGIVQMAAQARAAGVDLLITTEAEHEADFQEVAAGNVFVVDAGANPDPVLNAS